MRYSRRSALTAFAIAALAACGSPPERASVRVHGSTATVTVERMPSHPSLAEYERKAIVEIGAQSSTQMQLFPDSGGNSRTNLYQLNARQVLLLDGEASYTIDVTTGAVSKDDVRRKAGAFIGSFDVDDSSRWRFIPAAERAELPTEFRRGP
jgi:hypothetical protein